MSFFSDLFSDLNKTNIVLGITVALLAIIGLVLGWFKNLWLWFKRILQRGHQSSPSLPIPKETLVLVPDGPRSFWWSVGAVKDQPAMCLHGRVKATNMSKYNVVVPSAKIRKPKTTGFVLVQAPDRNAYGHHGIESGQITNLSFDFVVVPPVKEKGEPFRCDVAILDNFGNEHWLKNIEFQSH